MEKLYLVNNVEVSEKPSNGETYERLLMIDGHVLERNTYQASTQEERDEQKKLSEISWRDNELDYVDSKNYGASFPYADQVETYKQDLRDYPETANFTSFNRPLRPVTDNNKQIIT